MRHAAIFLPTSLTWGGAPATVRPGRRSRESRDRRGDRRRVNGPHPRHLIDVDPVLGAVEHRLEHRQRLARQNGDLPALKWNRARWQRPSGEGVRVQGKGPPVCGPTTGELARLASSAARSRLPQVTSWEGSKQRGAFRWWHEHVDVEVARAARGPELRGKPVRLRHRRRADASLRQRTVYRQEFLAESAHSVVRVSGRATAAGVRPAVGSDSANSRTSSRVSAVATSSGNGFS